MEMEYSSCIPPGFRFHPTEEELVGYYLNRKINSLKIDLDVIVDIDLYRMEPWDIQDRCRLGHEERNEWYFFSHKDRKYPTGTRTNRATTAGFWKATGRDKAVISKDRIIGMRKTLVFYKGRAPNGRKSDWIMHEYRLQSSEHGPPQEEGWVVCRAFKKPIPSEKQGFEAWNYNKYLIPSNPTTPTTTSILHNLIINPCSTHLPQGMNNFHHPAPLIPPESNIHTPFDQNQMVDLPNLDSPSISTSFATTKNDSNNNNFEHSTTAAAVAAIADDQEFEDEKRNFGYNNHFNDWKSFDREVTSQVIESSSFGYTNFPYNDDQLDAQNPLSNVFQCFPNDLI